MTQAGRENQTGTIVPVVEAGRPDAPLPAVVKDGNAVAAVPEKTGAVM
ncbi:hypothetical protein [Acetobacter senegalensis]|nr:hypothetical protein [Acetobacter senegalensis]